MVVRDPRDRLVSAWKWFTTAQTSYIKDILEASKPDHDLLMSDKTDFNKWISIALRYWNPHWAPQTEIHPKWRQFELINIADIDKLGWGHQKKTRTSNAWEEYYTPSVLQLVEGIYAEDLEMWEVIKDGINTGTNRIL